MKRPVTYRKFNRGNSAESQEKEHDKGLVLGNFEFERLVIPRVSSAHRPNIENKIKFVLEDHIETEDPVGTPSNAGGDDLGDQLKQLFVFNKMLQKGPKSKFFAHLEEAKNQDLLINKRNSITNTPKPPLQLNELITLKKIRVTKNSGVIKRMLHVPTLKMIDLQVHCFHNLN